MTTIRPLPPYLARRYHGWKATTHLDNKVWYRRLAEEGQRPREMIIACCDSRIHVTAMFGSESDELFIHRNIAALVPRFGPDGNHHATSSAIEFAVTTLRVSHIIVMGHSFCGGIKSCHDMCTGHAPELELKTSLVGRWLDILRPGFETLEQGLSEEEACRALERKAVLVSLENLMTFPMVQRAIDDGAVTIHGLWADIADGGLESFDSEKGRFVPV
jgi:carbonic anhydrase